MLRPEEKQKIKDIIQCIILFINSMELNNAEIFAIRSLLESLNQLNMRLEEKQIDASIKSIQNIYYNVFSSVTNPNLHAYLVLIEHILNCILPLVYWDINGNVNDLNTHLFFSEKIRKSRNAFDMPSQIPNDFQFHLDTLNSITSEILTRLNTVLENAKRTNTTHFFTPINNLTYPTPTIGGTLQHYSLVSSFQALRPSVNNINNNNASTPPSIRRKF